MSEDWIECSERLPEEDGRYLVFPIGKYYGEVVNFTKWHYEEIPSNSFFFEHYEMLHVITPTHWMPLPAPPKVPENLKTNPVSTEGSK